MSLTVDLEMPRAAPIWRVLKVPPCSSCSVCRSLLMVTLGVGIAGSGQKTGQRTAAFGSLRTPRQVSAIKMEGCPPSAWNGVRHHAGTLSAISVESCPPSVECAMVIDLSRCDLLSGHFYGKRSRLATCSKNRGHFCLYLSTNSDPKPEACLNNSGGTNNLGYYEPKSCERNCAEHVLGLWKLSR